MPTSRGIARARPPPDVKALVTGAGGFVGQWLCRALLRSGWEVAGTTLGPTPAPGTLSADERAAIAWRSVDLRPATDRRTLAGLVARERPDAIFHLAGVSSIAAAAADPSAAVEANVGALVRLCDAVRHERLAAAWDPVILVVGSAEQYGRHEPAAMPLGESTALRPRTVYAASKSAQEQFALAAARADGLRVVCTRSFNHSGPGQRPDFVLPAVAARVAAVRRSGGGAVAIGNTDVVRDFLHVEDAVGAYIALAQRGRPGEVYNVCSGTGISVGAIAAEFLARAGVSAGLRPDPELQRPADIPVLVGDPSKLHGDTGWSPVRSRAELLDDLLHAAS